MCSNGLIGAKVGIVGLGRIGLAIAKRLIPFEVSKIMYTGRQPKAEGNLKNVENSGITHWFCWLAAAEVSADFVSFDQLLKESDVVIISCALTEETKGMFGPAAFASMKPSAVLINTSRGGEYFKMCSSLMLRWEFRKLFEIWRECRSFVNNVITRFSLIRNHQSRSTDPRAENGTNRRCRFGCDDTWTLAGRSWTDQTKKLRSERFDCDGHPTLKLFAGFLSVVVLIPHIGSATVQTRTAMAMLTARNVIAALEGQQMPAQLLWLQEFLLDFVVHT